MALQVVFLGDSCTAGQGDPTRLGWTGRVVAAAIGRGLDVRATNLGVGGATSEQVALHWERAARVRVRPGDDVRIIVCVGANDTTAIGYGRTWVDPATSDRSLSRLLDRAQALGYHAFVLGPGPACLPAQDERSAALEAVFAQRCGERSVPFVPILSALLADPR